MFGFFYVCDFFFWGGVPASLTRSPPDLKRFSEARIRASKLTTFVNFQLKDLDLREFAAQSCSECRGHARRGVLGGGRGLGRGLQTPLGGLSR